jgi:CRISPR type III-A-associated protein Csm2
LRIVWGELRRIELDWPTIGGRDLPLLKPKLAYLAGRAASVGRGVADVHQTLTPAIDLVGDDRDRFDRLVQFVEAVLAYFYAGPQFSGR